jgi:hypothetical protein
MPKPSAPFPFPDKFDALSKQGAALLADCIQAFWTRRGYFVTAERFELRPGAWGVRSNLVGGLPARWRGRG